MKPSTDLARDQLAAVLLCWSDGLFRFLLKMPGLQAVICKSGPTQIGTSVSASIKELEFHANDSLAGEIRIRPEGL